MPPRRRLRRHARPVQLKKLDQLVAMAAYAQSDAVWQTWRARHITLRKALEMVAACEAEIITRKTANGIITFYKETKPTRASSASPCTLTMATMLAVARRRDGREAPLTFSERNHVDKFSVWAFEFDRKNKSTVGPKVSESDVALARKLFHRGTKALSPQIRSTVQALYLAAPVDPVAA